MFNWIEYLDLAHDLSEQNSERSQRSAISRAYYAIFCSCRNWLKAQEPDIVSRKSSGDELRDLLQALQSSQD